jgi:epoxide hydrolase-like predicted phosphatase
MTIKAIVFDLGGVLVELDISKFFREIYAPFPLARPKTPFMLKFFKHSDEYHMGEMDEESFYHLSCDILQIDKNQIPQEKFFKAFNKIISGLNKKMVQLLKNLYQSKLYKLICLSNVNESHWTHLNTINCEFLDYFDEIILSYIVHLIKPQRKIFELTIEKAKCEPENIAYIDDGIKNVKAAEELGIISLLFKNYSTLVRDFKKLGIQYQ